MERFKNLENMYEGNSNDSIENFVLQMHLLYLNGDRTLHDCMDMDDKNNYFCDMIKVDLMFICFYWKHSIQDYQSYKLTKRSYSTSTEQENSMFEKPNLQLINNNLPVNTNNNSSTIETKLIHIGQSTG